MRSPDADAVRAFLARAARRLDWMQAVRGAAMLYLAVSVGVVLGGARQDTAWRAVISGLVIGLVGGMLGWVWWRSRRHSISRLVELHAPQCRNLLITAAELEQAAPSEYVRSLVYRDAARATSALDAATLFPARNTIGALLLGITVFGLSIARTNAAGAARAISPNAVAAIDGVEIAVTSPSYANRKSASSHDPARIEALMGSRLHLLVHARAATVTMTTLHGPQPLQETTPGEFSGDVVLDADGYLALEPMNRGGQGATRRLIGLSAIEDHPPRVHVTAPGKDLKLPDGRRTLDLTVLADDDIGLASLRLRFTRVSGSGERFAFTEGEVPLTIERTDSHSWKARAQWKLDSLALEPGDLVVYRAIATDRRPGALPVESDSWIAEVLAPGGEAAGGFSLDPEQERYALSQQMVILKTERLLAKRSSLPPDALADSAAELAVEQRRVRAEFVFMMGGEIGAADDGLVDPTSLNEEVEAAGEGDLAAGRMLNQGRDALLRSIRFMSQAAKALTGADVTAALPVEKSALTQLERAFSHSRIILRALTLHERLDYSRRLTGVLSDASREMRPITQPAPDPRTVALRHALSEVATLAGAARFADDAPTRTSALAEDILRLDPASDPLRQVSRALLEAAAAIGRGEGTAAHVMMDRAATGLAAVLRGGLLAAPLQPSALDLDRLKGARADALRHAPGAQ